MELCSAHSQLSLEDRGDLRSNTELLAVQSADVADVASGGVAVVPQHLVLVLRTFPLNDVAQWVNQRVSCERRELQVVRNMVFAHRHLTFQARFESQSFTFWAAVTVHLFCQLFLQRDKKK